MATKDQNVMKYCCLYASDFHLEMILLPYIKKNINTSKIIIFTQRNLLDSMMVLLERVNLSNEYKKKILNLTFWNNMKFIDFEKDAIEYTIIINGDTNYIKKINNQIEKLKLKYINIIDCYNINDNKLNIDEIKNQYDEILNTKKI